MRKSKRSFPTIQSGSMADIAFLLLIFFLVTTSIISNKGLFLVLPENPELTDEVPVNINERNLFNIRINSQDNLMVEGELVTDISGLRARVREFVMNPQRYEYLAENPRSAIVSIKTNRGTSHGAFISILDEVQGAYYDIYSERAGVTNDEWRSLTSKLSFPENRELYERGRGKTHDGKVEIPMNISIAEPE